MLPLNTTRYTFTYDNLKVTVAYPKLKRKKELKVAFDCCIFYSANFYFLHTYHIFDLPLCLFCRRGLADDLGAEALMMDALEKVEKDIKKPLMRNDKKGMALLMAEFDKINKK